MKNYSKITENKDILTKEYADSKYAKLNGGITYTKLVGSVDFTLTKYTDDPFFYEQNAATWEQNSVIGGKALTSTTDIGLLIGNSYTLGVNLQGTTTLFRATAEEGSSYGWPGVKILWFKREDISAQFFIYDHCTIVGENIEAGNGCIFAADLSSDITLADIAGLGGDRGIINPATITNSAIKINSAVTMYINTNNVINGTKTNGSITLTASNKGSVDYELEIFATTTEGLLEIINKQKVTESTISNWGFTKNVGTVTAVVVNGYHYDPEGGIVDLGTFLTSHQSIRTLNTDNNTSQTVSAGESISGAGAINLHKIAKTGSYTDLLNAPKIPAAVTESTVSGWGFTKNTGTITGIKMNNVNKGTSGVVDLGTVLTAHQDISGKLDKTKYEVNKVIDFGSTGVLYVGKFNVYDTNITCDITSTTSTTYSGKLVIATQNYVITKMTVYGDASNTVAPNFFIRPSSSKSDPYVEIYFKPAAYSKNVVHIYGSSIAAEPTNVCTSISAVPNTATHKPINALTETFQKRLTAGTNINITNSTISAVDTGATSVEVTGTGNAVTAASYNTANRKLTLTKGSTFLTSHQDISGLMPKSGGAFTGNISVPKTITFTDETNPFIKMRTGDTDFYFQSTSGQFGLGPTWDKATHWDANGNVTFPTVPKVGSTSLVLTSAFSLSGTTLTITI